ncbi:MAG: translation initiation factor [Ignavibacteria bacterium]|nr:translation initiation factor [Ignavibacteria bacterium]
MAGLKDLGSLLNLTEFASQPEPEKKRGYNGNVMRIKVRMEKRRGKTLTIVWGFSTHPVEMIRLLDVFKKKLGAGGQILDKQIEIQGDHVDRIKQLLKTEGYTLGN